MAKNEPKQQPDETKIETEETKQPATQPTRDQVEAQAKRAELYARAERLEVEAQRAAEVGAKPAAQLREAEKLWLEAGDTARAAVAGKVAAMYDEEPK